MGSGTSTSCPVLAQQEDHHQRRRPELLDLPRRVGVVDPEGRARAPVGELPAVGVVLGVVGDQSQAVEPVRHPARVPDRVVRLDAHRQRQPGLGPHLFLHSPGYPDVDDIDDAWEPVSLNVYRELEES